MRDEKTLKKRSRLILTLAFGLSLVATTRARAENPVVDWNKIAVTTVVTNAKQTPAASAVFLAYMHLAVYDAVNAIDHRFHPYLFTADAPAGASQDAAAIAAAHRVLVNYFPSQQSSLDTQFNAAIAALADTPSNIAAGEAVGEAAADALIAARSNDGLFANVPYTPPVGPGFWQPTPPAFAPPITPWLGQMTPFTMTTASQFFPDEGPDSLNSEQWIDDYDQVMTLGAINSAARTPQQTEIGLFWTEHATQQDARAFRNLAVERGLSISDTARFMAMLWAGAADASIGCWNAKYSFSFWRPVTAIRVGGDNPELTADPSWTPLGITPAHPEYPSAHGCFTGAISAILAKFFGTKHVEFSVDSLVTNTTHTYDSTDELMTEVENARIYAGIHYHHSVIQGKVLGRKVARQLAKDFFKPVSGRGSHQKDSLRRP